MRTTVHTTNYKLQYKLQYMYGNSLIPRPSHFVGVPHKIQRPQHEASVVIKTIHIHVVTEEHFLMLDCKAVEYNVQILYTHT